MRYWTEQNGTVYEISKNVHQKGSLMTCPRSGSTIPIIHKFVWIIKICRKPQKILPFVKSKVVFPCQVKQDWPTKMWMLMAKNFRMFVNINTKLPYFIHQFFNLLSLNGDIWAYFLGCITQEFSPTRIFSRVNPTKYTL